MTEDTGMTEEEMDDVVKKVSDNLDKYVKETGRTGVGVAHAIFIGAAGELASVLSAKDVVTGAEMATESLRTFLEDAERECGGEDTKETLEEVVALAHECAEEMSEYVERTGRTGVRTAYAAISKVSRHLPDDDVSVDDVVTAMEMMAKNDRGFLDLVE